MEYSTKQFKRCDLISVSGRVDSSTSASFSEAIDASMNNGQYKIVLDLGGVEFMSSAGFRALLGGQRTCKRYNRGEIVLSNVPDRVKEALDLAGFLALFKLFEDETSAVGFF
ncbi:MAG: STAS domain-containing protein [Anaerolineales bacterium]|nr:STAS domain-containing protein [Anaerolineales bacterium]